MKASLNNFAVSQFDNKMMILGQMLELGQDSVQEHCNVMETAAGIGDCLRVFFVGEEFLKAAEGPSRLAADGRFTFCRDVEEVRKYPGTRGIPADIPFC